MLIGMTMKSLSDSKEVVTITHPYEKEEKEDLSKLVAEKLISLVKNLRNELLFTKIQLNSFQNIIKELPEERNLLASALAVIDMLTEDKEC